MYTNVCEVGPAPSRKFLSLRQEYSSKYSKAAKFVPRYAANASFPEEIFHVSNTTPKIFNLSIEKCSKHPQISRRRLCKIIF